MCAPVAIANAVADALGRDDVELPLTPPRVWELLQVESVKPAPFGYVRAESLDEALAALAERGDGREADRRRAEPRPCAQHAPRPAERSSSTSTAPGLDGVDGERRRADRRHVRQAALERRRARPSRSSRAALPFVGHFVTRNRGTVGGSIAHADAAAELPLCLAALDGLVVRRRAGRTAGDPGRRRSSSRTT